MMGLKNHRLKKRAEKETAMRLTINGQSVEVSGVTHVDELMRQLSLDVRKVAVERNLTIVPRSTYSAARLEDGDSLEIITFIGGG
jgi:thiamine biosynthesis protein ThiS